MDHQFETLGPERFQQLVQALLKSAFPRTTCFPVGQPDGGRDASVGTESEDDGFIVYQVKFTRKPSEIEDVKEWLLEKLSQEKDKILELIERGASEYILVTNVSGTSHLDVGSIDKTLAAIRAELPISIQCWWRDDLNRRLDSEWNIKLRYPEILSGHDFFHLLLETVTGQDSLRRSNALKAFLADQYEGDVDVKFKQIELHNKLLDLFIDLPFSLRVDASSLRSVSGSALRLKRRQIDRRTHFVESEEGRDDQGTSSFLLYDAHDLANQVVVEGAPGQGKSTLAQYLCQVHRIRILQKTEDLERLPEGHRTSPLRIPFKVDLRDLGAWLVGTDPFATGSSNLIADHSRSLEAFLAKLVSHHSGGIEFNVNDLLETSKVTPLLIVLDGLDEVVDIKQRSEVVGAVVKAIPRLRENCPNLFVVVTSRPAAFANSPGFDVQSFPQLQLGSVGRSQISSYAERWMDVRRLSFKERQEFNTILSEKMEAPHLRDLARNPMQLAILLSLILTQGAALPDKRTSLYDTYVDLFFSREASKSAAVRKHIDLLKELHGYLGWAIHSRAETDEKASGGRISDDDLRALLAFYLAEEDHGTEIINEIFNAMLERVVMIVSRIQGTYEFEVQPLREYFAARHLYNTASYSPPGQERRGTKPDRFDAIARNFYWLNVVRFYCGCFSKGELLDLADRIKELIADPILGQTRHPVNLAAMLLADWVFAQSPKATAQLVEVLSSANALRRLSAPVYQSSANIVSLPERSGGLALFERGFEILETFGEHGRVDQLFELARVVSRQASPEGLVNRWVESKLPAEKIDHWLEIGVATNAMENASRQEILDRIGGQFSRNIILVLVQAGRFDCILNSEHHADLLKNALLMTPDPYWPGPIGTPPLFFLPALIGDSFDLTSNRDYLLKAAKEMLPDEEWAKQQFLFVRQCYELSIGVRDALGEPSARRVSIAHEALLEKCISMWGPMPAVIFGVVSFVDHRRVSTSSAPFDFFDRNVSMVKKYRAAKARRGDISWWTEQLKAAPLRGETNFLLLAHFREASLAVIQSCVALTEEILGRMSEEDWKAFRDVFDDTFSGGRSKEHWPLDDLSGFKSRKALCLLAIRSPATLTSRLLTEAYHDEEVSDVCGSRLKQSWAIEAILLGQLSWDEVAPIVTQTYVEGSFGHFSNLTRAMRSGRSKLPKKIADEVLRDPTRYPHAIWEFAERAANAAVAKSIRAVGAVAKSDKWFVT